ncbi:MAG: hypothetical protein SO191_08665 [Butyricimonas virosa]|uniref:hypothetical protein n=1 Tax=Butyricimonas virosa TaxID=544645 RepID=UPI00242CF3BA|nr:hypothetical protein [Butyricimonas virosa]MCI7390385.1 hypothetical protein [Butyricimonas virosa]MDY4904940.1 hypothetical protein [Butyricimonas virosa]
MIEPDIKIIAVDNDSSELTRIVKTFNKLRISCFPIEYNIGDEIEEKYSNVRIAFFDINLGLGNPSDSDLCNIISSALKEIIDRNNGPYALIFWSKHTAKVNLIKKYINEREKENIPSPLIVETIDKALVIDDEKFLIEIKRILSNSTLEAMFDYQEKVKKAAAKTINSIFSLIPNDTDKWGEHEAFEKNFDLVFSKMASNTLGRELAVKKPNLAIQRTLFPILLYNIQKESLSNIWEYKMKALKKEDVLKFPTNFNINILNSIYHIHYDSSLTKDERGIIIKMNMNTKHFTSVFGKKKDSFFRDFFDFKKANKGQTEEEFETMIKTFLNKIEPVFVEISAACDYAQQNNRACKYLFGIKYPISSNVTLRKSDYTFPTPIFAIENVNFQIIFNFRFVFGYSITNGVLGQIKFKLSDDLVNQIGNRYANYTSRIGIISH